MALYNKMRPKNLSEVRGQDKIIDIIKSNIASGNLPNAMLFVGTRGVGKTTIARAIARLLNCEHPLEDKNCCDECPSCKAILQGTSLDVIELDAATNNGVDNVREIIESVQYKPIAKKKVVIADEVHLFSTGAWNAFLKTMEEPPKDVLFILCTTELHKVPATIISRCRKFEFETISVEVIVEKLKAINVLLGKEAEEEALYVIAKAAKGSMRDAESIYEAFLDTEGMITASYVRETLGYTAEEHVFSILDAIVSANPVLATSVIEDVFEKGGSLNFLLEECMRTLMDIISVKMSGDITDKGNSAEYLEKITDYAFTLETQRLFEIADAFCKTYGSKTSDKLLSFQAMLIELACTQSTITALLQRVEQLELEVKQLKSTGMSFVASAVSELDESCCDPEYMAALAECADEVEYAEEPKQEAVESDIPTQSAVLESSVPGQNSTQSADCSDELRRLGFTVVDDVPSFEEEALDDSMLEEPATTPAVVSDSVSAEAKVDEIVDNAPSNTGAAVGGASFFDDFARLFESFS